MRLALTVVSPGAQRTADVVLEADPATPVAQVAAELGRFMDGDWTAQGPPSIGAGGEPVRGCSGSPVRARRARSPWLPLNPASRARSRCTSAAGGFLLELSLLESPIRDGAVLSLGGPEGGVTPEPGGLVEIRVVSGPGAGSIYWLPAGYADIGSGPVDVRVRDRAVARARPAGVRRRPGPLPGRSL